MRRSLPGRSGRLRHSRGYPTDTSSKRAPLGFS
jgi:hypothetical protein